MTKTPSSSSAQRILALLLVLASIGLSWSLAATIGWWYAAHDPVSLEDLDEEQRHELAQSLLLLSPGTFEPALFDARVGYTLKPDTEIEAWGANFKTNDLGYRSDPSKKSPESFRIVFVGDSWAFGLGVDEEDAFPRQLEILANSQSGLDRPVEAWTLALPGYNLLNGTAALESLLDVLEPDAVVFCPTSNDIDSTHAVLTNGSLSRRPLMSDDFGGPLPLTFHSLFVGSHLAVDRWHQGMLAISNVQNILEKKGVPSVVFFTGRWLKSIALHLTAQADISSPILITPTELSGVEWRNPPPYRHPTPEAHRIYASLVYVGLGTVLPWEPLDRAPDTSDVLFLSSDRRSDGFSRAQAEWKRITAISIPSEFVPGSGESQQSLGGLSASDGWLGRSGVLLIRKLPDRAKLRITIRKIAESDFLYPQTMTVTIPTSDGGTRIQQQIHSGDPPEEALTVPIPPEIEAGMAIDVVFEMERATLQEGSSRPRSLQILSIEQI